MIELLISALPPSVNKAYANNKGTGKGRYKTKAYTSWQNVAGWDLQRHKRQGAIIGAFVCQIVVDRSKRHKLADIDNFIKPTLDLLQTFNIIENDNLAESVHIRWGDVPNAAMKIFLDKYQERNAA